MSNEQKGKIIIAGSRDLFPSAKFIESCILDFGLNHDITELVSGNAKGVDLCAETWRDEYREHLDIKRFPYLSQHGKAGGPIRNMEMAKYADILLLIWDGESKGSKNMKENMLLLNKPVYEIIVKIHEGKNDK